MKVQIRHIKTDAGTFAIYVVVCADGSVRNFSGDYKAAFAFAEAV